MSPERYRLIFASHSSTSSHSGFRKDNIGLHVRESVCDKHQNFIIISAFVAMTHGSIGRWKRWFGPIGRWWVISFSSRDTPVASRGGYGIFEIISLPFTITLPSHSISKESRKIFPAPYEFHSPARINWCVPQSQARRCRFSSHKNKFWDCSQIFQHCWLNILLKQWCWTNNVEQFDPRLIRQFGLIPRTCIKAFVPRSWCCLPRHRPPGGKLALINS